MWLAEGKGLDGEQSRTIEPRIPEYKAPRNAWRRDIHKAVMEEKEK